MKSLRPATTSDLLSIQDLLKNLSLPLDGVEANLQNFLIYSSGEKIIACGGYESYFPAALLRSVAVLPEYQGRGIGRAIVQSLLQKCSAAGYQTVFLLTIDADLYFADNFGFTRTDRAHVPQAVKKSLEFQFAGCQSAICMIKKLE